MRVEVLRPRHDGGREAELHAGNVQGVLLAVLHEDVQDAVLVLCRLPVLPDEATAGGLEGDGHFADRGV